MTWLLVVSLTFTMAGHSIKLPDIRMSGGNTEQQCYAFAADLQARMIADQSARLSANFHCEKK